MRVLLHICCAPCAIGPYEDLKRRGHDVTGYFYNPNIHPLIEFRRRMKALKVLQERIPLAVTYEEDYGLMHYLASVRWAGTERCADCYRLRLERTARHAAEHGFEAMTTTLLGSTRQNHALIERTGRECAGRHGVEFLYADWRPCAEEGHRRAREMKLYLQNYCGCIFSEWDRFKDTAEHVYRGPGPAATPRRGPA
jgi:predicted adenine nucleotide alpha hydrolase (AANH) superfamily ATPase